MIMLSTIWLFVALICLWNGIALRRNLKIARGMGYTIYLCPVSPYNTFLLLLTALLGGSFDWLPNFLYEWIRPALIGWEFKSKYSLNARIGPNFILVTPGGNTLMVGDPETCHGILTRRTDFLRPKILADLLARHGPNLASSEHTEWQRHRKVVAPIFNERIMPLVWEESSQQGQDMLNHFVKPSHADAAHGEIFEETNATIRGLRTIAVNVIGCTCYGTKSSWIENRRISVALPGYKLTLMEALKAMTSVGLAAPNLPPKLLQMPFMPRKLQILGRANAEFPGLVRRIIAEQRRSPVPGIHLLGHLVELVESSGVSKHQTPSNHLTETEIGANLFLFIVAGFDTTANTLAYAVLMLAIYPEWQNWVIAGIDEVKASQSMSYEASFPLLTRCMALLYETLRVFTPVPNMARCTIGPQTIMGHYIPAGTNIQVAGALIHMSPDLYGPDPLIFRPSRWCSGPNLTGLTACEALIDPPRGTFLPWGTGPRICPGIKMAQVEFVAVIREIFASWKVEPARKDGEDMQMASKRLRDLVDDNTMKVTLQVKRPEDAVLRWTKR